MNMNLSKFAVIEDLLITKPTDAEFLANFKKAIDALIKQNARSVAGENNTCMYRSPDGNRCAVGHLIPDELYHPDIEGCVINDADLEGRRNQDRTDILRTLQRSHDQTEDYFSNWAYHFVDRLCYLLGNGWGFGEDAEDGGALRNKCLKIVEEYSRKMDLD